MYLTRIPLDLTKRKTLYALTSPSIFHGAIEASFGGGRKLFWKNRGKALYRGCRKSGGDRRY